ncbi:Glycine cleavage system transcriptional activator [Pseudoalteromonas holothuriae]|uniref:Glycine cleavage system transcriptional activator n=1 Tax=Pseudoalteromonas holothuriae TaxID=2963714 RepID=A0A9W4QTF2_9GAMM|nr:MULTISPECIES: LysR substrate-binding domain-containing protein [unclassified Pseudoalteromonas]CAH9050379.1 Glycine cleavage system transcriptional activator [Pseudoalteromonas sp. CIP111951]CAH9052307.1 Glycine cleavage system transcriptional activator [Pseudoalteromonas sp. CIP111854]
MSLPPLKSLMYFKYAAQLGSFKLASQQLFVTQAAISQQIRALEAHLSCELFIRQTRKVTLTRQGEQLLPYVLAAFSQFEEGVKALHQDPSPHTLNLSVLPSFAACWLLPKIHDFQQHHSDIKLRIDPSDKLIDFEQGEADLGIRFGLGNYMDVHSELLGGDHMLLVYKSDMLDKTKPLKPQLLAQRLIMDVCPDADRAWQLMFDELGVTEEQKPDFLEIDNAALVVQSVLSGQGVGMLRRRLIESQLAHLQLQIWPGFELLCEYQYYLVGPMSHFSWTKVMAFKNWLQLHFNQSC